MWQADSSAPRRARNIFFFPKLSTFALAMAAAYADPVGAAEGGAPSSEAVRLKEVEVSATGTRGYAAGAAVSATKTDTLLLDVPQTVSVVPETLIEAQRDLNMKEVLKNVPGVTFSAGEGRRDQFTIRGFGAELDNYVDGVREPAALRDLSNIEQVEVLKGPAAVLFGRGSAGGIINRITKKPGTESRREAQLTVGSFALRRGDFDLATSTAVNPVALRLTGAYEDADSFRDIIHGTRQALAPSLLWTVSPATRLLLQAEYLRHTVTPDRGIPSINGQPAAVPISNFYGEPYDFSRREVVNGGLTLDHRLDGTLTLHAVLRANTMDLDAINTRNLSVQSNQRTLTRNVTHFPKQRAYYTGLVELVQKERLGGMEHQFLYGVELSRQVGDLLVQQVGGAQYNIDVYQPVHKVSQPVFGAPSFNTYFVGKTAAVYFQDQMSLSQHWKMVGGIRYDLFEQTQLDRRSNVTLARSDRAWSPRAGLLFQPTAQNTLYASASRSFQPRGDDLFFVNATAAQLEPTSSLQYELGSKNEFLGGRMQANLALYQITQTNLPTRDPNDPAGIRQIQVGEQRSRGVELELVGEMTKRWKIFSGLSLIRAEIVRSNNDLQGKRPENVADKMANLWSVYEIGKGFSAGGGLYYMGSRYTSPANRVTIPAYTRADAALYYKAKPFALALNVNNILNRTYYEGATNDNQILPGAPRSVLLTLRTGF